MAEDEDRERDPAAETGRLAGRAVNTVGLRLLRFRSVRQAIRRAAAEAAPERGDPPPPAGNESS